MLVNYFFSKIGITKKNINMKTVKYILFFIISLSFASLFFTANSETSKPEEPQTITLQKMWQDGDYWKCETYTNHSPTYGMYTAADFHYNNRNRSEIYRNQEDGISGRTICSPVNGTAYIHMYVYNDIIHYSTINALNVINGTVDPPHNSFAFNDQNGQLKKVDMILVIDVGLYRPLLVHLNINSSFFTPSVIAKLRTAVSKFYYNNASVVAVNTGINVSAGNNLGTIYYWGNANQYHLHFQVNSGSGYNEETPILGLPQDLSNPSIVNLMGQTIFNSTYETIIGSVHQYPAMMRRTNLYINDAIQINTTWDGGGNINIRSYAGGTIIGSLPNGATGTLLSSNPTAAKIYNGTTFHLWYNVNVNSMNGWIASEYFDKTTTPQLQLSVTPTDTQVVDWGQQYSFNFTVTSNSSPISDAYIAVQDPIRLQTVPSGPTNSSGQCSYSYTVPTNTANNTYTFNLYAHKTGYQNSSTVIRYVQVQHSTSGSASIQTGITILPNPVLLNSNFTSSFTLKETQGYAVTYDSITCAILKNDYSFCFDMQRFAGVTIQANGTWPYSSNGILNYPQYQSGTYRAIARGKRNGSWSDFGTTGSGQNNVLFTVQNPPLLPPPVLIGPGSANPPYPTINSLTPTFQWQAVSGALRYGLYIRRMSDSVLILDDSNFTGTSFIIPAGYLSYNILYRWNMATYNSIGIRGNVSEKLWFYTPLPSSILYHQGIIPTEYNLYQNYPNPFNSETRITFDVPNTENVSIIIFDNLGRAIKELFSEELSTGRYEISYNATNLSSGIYYYKLVTPNYKSVKKMLIIK